MTARPMSPPIVLLACSGCFPGFWTSRGSFQLLRIFRNLLSCQISAPRKKRGSKSRSPDYGGERTLAVSLNEAEQHEGDALVLLVSLARAASDRSGERCIIRRAEKDTGLELSLKEVGANNKVLCKSDTEHKKFFSGTSSRGCQPDGRYFCRPVRQARLRTSATCRRLLPPSAVAAPRAFKAWAIGRRLAPLALSGSMSGRMWR
jgi:hypothetical protein